MTCEGFCRVVRGFFYFRNGVAHRNGQSSAAVDGVTVFHAGTGRHGPDRPFHTSGGRVLGVTAVAPTLAQARDRAYAGVAPIEWDGMQHRSDIALAASRRAGERVG